MSGVNFINKNKGEIEKNRKFIHNFSVFDKVRFYFQKIDINIDTCFSKKPERNRKNKTNAFHWKVFSGWRTPAIENYKSINQFGG
ncbi:MAG TPA: hypothetical protein VER14_09545 [Phototrophicaceae bacterium]|nr:hypothetical protein [Phototrophicaceae bacterium]